MTTMAGTVVRIDLGTISDGKPIGVNFYELTTSMILSPSLKVVSKVCRSDFLICLGKFAIAPLSCKLFTDLTSGCFGL